MKVYLSKWSTILIHLIFWIGYFGLLVHFLSNRLEFDAAISRGLILVLPQIVLAYLNMEVLIPKFFIRKKYLHYFFVVGLSLGALYYFYYSNRDTRLPEREIVQNNRQGRFLRKPPPRIESRETRPWFRGSESRPFHLLHARALLNMILPVAILLLSTAYKTSSIALKREKEATALKNEKLKAEMKFLKSQINPHFLFNALNNIYALSYVKSERTPEMILKLSDMLRYLLYESSEDKVPLKKEITYIQNYIDLQQLKDDNKANIEAQFEVDNENHMIHPMLFIPFVENSFKHSKIEDLEKGWINMQLTAGDDSIRFHISNSIPGTEYTKDKAGGIGLQNVKRRLNLLYPDKHELNIQKSDYSFSVTLNLLL